MSIKFIQRPKYILNHQLTSEFTTVNVGEDWEFSGYMINTQDGSDWEMKLTEGATDSFIFKAESNTDTLNTPWDKRSDNKDTLLYYVKGSGILQILFSV